MTDLDAARKEHDLLVAYLRLKVERWDWHGVADAAMDLRELEAANPELRR